MRRLASIPGIGGLTAHAIVTAIGDGRQFASARDFAAWCGLTPRRNTRAPASAHDRRHQPPGRHPAAQAAGARRQHRHAQRPLAQPIARPHGSAASCPPSGQGRGAGAGRQDRPHRLGRAVSAGTYLPPRRPPPTQRPTAEPGAVLAAVKPAARRLRRWPAARLDRACARRSAMLRSGRRNRRFQSNQEMALVLCPTFRPASPLLATPPDTRKEHQAATAKWSGPGSGHSALSSRLQARRNAWNPIRVTHRGQRSADRTNRPDT